MKMQSTPPKNVRRGPCAEGVRLRDIDVDALVRDVRNLVEHARDERVRPTCEHDRVMKTMEVVCAAVRARGELEDGGDVRPSDLAALASVGPAHVRQLLKAGVLGRSGTGQIRHRDATRWLARYALEDYGDTKVWITPSWMTEVLFHTIEIVAQFVCRTELPEGAQFECERWHLTYRLHLPRELRLSPSETEALAERVRKRLEAIDARSIERERRYSDLL